MARRTRSGGSTLKTLIADDVVKVEFLPNKNLNYSIEAFSSGMTDLSYRQTAPDMVTIINEGDQSFFADYALNATIEMGATNNKTETDFHMISGPTRSNARTVLVPG